MAYRRSRHRRMSKKAGRASRKGSLRRSKKAGLRRSKKAGLRRSKRRGMNGGEMINNKNDGTVSVKEFLGADASPPWAPYWL